jgi:ethanolamine utilization microcompartment shell protein EutL
MSEAGRGGGQTSSDVKNAVEADFDRLENTFFDTGSGIERGEVALPEEEPSHADHQSRSWWQRRAGLAAGACVALAIMAMLMATGGADATSGGEAGAPDETALAQSPRR